MTDEPVAIEAQPISLTSVKGPDSKHQLVIDPPKLLSARCSGCGWSMSSVPTQAEIEEKFAAHYAAVHNEQEEPADG